MLQEVGAALGAQAGEKKVSVQLLQRADLRGFAVPKQTAFNLILKCGRKLNGVEVPITQFLVSCGARATDRTIRKTTAEPYIGRSGGCFRRTAVRR
jgi:hypothetical protein